MRLFFAFLKLIRWPNLFFIALTQSLFYFCIVSPFINSPSSLFILLVIASLCIAAAGYIINDYFDMQIDNINKPEKVVVDSIIKRRWAIMWHWILSLTGILISGFISYKTAEWSIVIINSICVIALWFYSTHFKKKLLSGNVIISILTAWTIIVVYLFSGASLFNLNGWENVAFSSKMKWLFKLAMLYSGFAFVLTLIREVVKDLEDMHGDSKFGCRTMPIVWGVPVAKVFVAVWLIVAAGALTVIQLYSWQTGYRVSVFYVLGFIVVPMIFLINSLKKSETTEDYHKISNSLKLIMLAGILSMLFFIN